MNVPMNNLVLGSVVTLRRNFTDLPFPAKMTPQQKEESVRRVAAAFKQEEQHLRPGEDNCPAAIVSAMRQKPHEAGIWFHYQQEEKSICALVNGLDSVVLGIQAAPQNEQEAIRVLKNAEDAVFENYPAALGEEFGYLTAKPLQAGSGMQMHVLVHLPVMTSLKQIAASAREIEGSDSCLVLPLSRNDGKNPSNLYHVVNMKTNYPDTHELISHVYRAVQKLTDKEKLLAEKMFTNPQSILHDQANRAYGILKHAMRLNEREFLSLWSSLRMGAENSILDCSLPFVDGLLRETADASKQSDMNNYQRAEYIRTRLREEENAVVRKI